MIIHHMSKWYPSANDNPRAREEILTTDDKYIQCRCPPKAAEMY